MSEYDGYKAELSDLVKKGGERLADAQYSALPCKVKSIRTSPFFSVDLIPLVQVLDDAGNPKSLSVIPCVPVAILLSGPFVFSVPVAVGTTGTARIYSRAITQWLVSGSESAIPEGARRGNRTDAVFIPDLQPGTARPDAEQSDRIVLGLDAGRVGITIDESGVVHAGAEATALFPVALSAPVTTDLTAIAADMQQLIALWAAVGRTFAPTFLAPTNSAATKLKAE